MKLYQGLFLLMLANKIFAINTYFVGDTLYVWSKNGLVIRDSNSFTAKKLDIIQNGSIVISMDDKTYRYEDEFAVEIFKQHITKDNYSNRELTNPSINIKGRWLKVKYLNKIGFVFDGFLSHFQPPKNINDRYGDFISNYFKSTFGLIKKLDYNSANIREINYEYGGGVSFNSIAAGGGVNYYYYVPKLSYDEVLILILYSGFIDDNPEYWQTKILKCIDPCSRRIIFSFCCALQTITITEIGRMTIIEFIAAC